MIKSKRFTAKELIIRFPGRNESHFEILKALLQGTDLGSYTPDNAGDWATSCADRILENLEND